jgi:hypothetical protein
MLFRAVRMLDRALTRVSAELSGKDDLSSTVPSPASVREAVAILQRAAAECARAEEVLKARVIEAEIRPQTESGCFQCADRDESTDTLGELTAVGEKQEPGGG